MTTVVCGHQPNYLPYPGYFHKMMHCDRFVYVDNVEFVGRGPFGWIHRNKVRIHGKDEHWLTVPVITSNRYHQDINRVEINNDEPWTRKHWRTIQLNYKDAPYFDRYADRIEALYARDWDRLVDLNLEFLRFFRQALSVEVPACRASEEGIEGEATGLILELCRHFNGEVYLSGEHGREYLDRKRIEASDIRVDFQDYSPVAYPQQYEGFVPNLSTLDLLLNCGPKSRDIIERGGSIRTGWGG